MLPVDIQVPVPGSYNSALAKPLPELSHPPATKTLPFVSSVAVKLLRPILMLPVAVHVPGVAAVAAVATVPVTDLLNPAKARRRVSKEQNRLRRVDRETDFFSLEPQVVRANPDVSRISLRKEGEVAWLESPNGLSATAEFQFRREVSRT